MSIFDQQLRATLARAVQSVLDLHTETTEEDLTCWDDDCQTCLDGGSHSMQVCSHCRNDHPEDTESFGFYSWPCPTIKAMERALEESNAEQRR